MPRVSALLTTATVAGLVVLLGSGSVALQETPHWITAWGTSHQTLGTAALTNATVRMIARVTIPGDAVRIRLDNTFGTDPLVIGNTYVGARIQGARLATGSNLQVFFDGSPGVTIPPGGSVTSDSVPMRVLAFQDLGVSLHVPGADVRPSQHSAAHVTSYVTVNGAGNETASDAASPFVETTSSTFWLKAIDVASSSSPGSIVAFGDSITDGTCSTLDAHDRWVDWLAVRLALGVSGTPAASKAVVNEGIGGNTITRANLQPPPVSPPGLERLERDVLTHQGVTDVILFMGTNDIRREAPAAQVISGMQDIIARVKSRGLTIVGVTIIPRHNRAPTQNNTGWNAAKTRVRNDVNRWIRTESPFDSVIDFDTVVQDAENADLIHPPFDCGDGIHPGPLGYYEMGRSVGLGLFR
jgi:lysophospholipase L1-like esterase